MDPRCDRGRYRSHKAGYPTLPNVKPRGARRPRLIIYDVQADLHEDDIISNIKSQNPELELTFEEINNVNLVFKNGPRNGETDIWVMETWSVAYNKLKNTKVFCQYSR